MNIRIVYIIVFFLITNCNIQKKIDHHGVHLLQKKSNDLIVSQTNKNDIIKILGPPSSESTFDNNIIFYIERKITTGKLYKLGKNEILVNNVLVLEIDSRGLLVKKDFYDLKKMKRLKVVEKTTEVDYQKTSFIYDFLSSMRQKINDPLGKRKKK